MSSGSAQQAASRRERIETLRYQLALEAQREAKEHATRLKLWNSGRLGWKLKPEQKEVLDAFRDERYQLYYIDWTRRGGKTFVAASYCIEEAIRNPRTHIRYGAAYLTDLEEFIIPTFEQILEDCPPELAPRWVGSKKRFIFPNGSTIKLVGLDKNPNGLRGNRINIIVLDEAGFVSKLQKIYQSIIIPATARQKKIKIIVISTPPEEAREHFAYELKLKAETQPNGFYLKKTIDDLTDMPESEKTRLFEEVGGKDSVTAQREFYCVWRVDATREIAPKYDREAHVIPFPKPKNANWTFAGDTGGVRDLTTGYIIGWDHDLGKACVWDERWFDNHTPTKVWTEGFNHEDFTTKDIKDQLQRFLDASGQTLVDAADLGFNATLPKKEDFQSSLSFLRNTFYRNEIMIHPRCELLIRTLEGGMLNTKCTDYVRTIALGHCDAVAALIYGLRHLDKTTDRRPKISDKDTLVFPNYNETERSLRAAYGA